MMQGVFVNSQCDATWRRGGGAVSQMKGGVGKLRHNVRNCSTRDSISLACLIPIVQILGKLEGKPKFPTTPQPIHHNWEVV